MNKTYHHLYVFHNAQLLSQTVSNVPQNHQLTLLSERAPTQRLSTLQKKKQLAIKG